MKRPPSNLLRTLGLTVALFSGAAITHAQQASRPFSGALTSPVAATQQSDSQEEPFIKPSRPGATNPADIQRAGVLQLEYGYDALFRSDAFRSQHTAPLALRLAAQKRLLVELDLDTVISEVVRDARERQTGVGDTRVGVQVVGLKDTETHPALAFAYYVKLPSASEDRGLGTGRTDHRAVALVSRQVGETDVDLNVAYLNVAGDDSHRRASGGQGAFAVSREFKNNLGYVSELSGQSVDDQQPRGVYALGALTYGISQRVRVDAGMRFGLNPSAARVGVVAGMTVGLGDVFGR